MEPISGVHEVLYVQPTYICVGTRQFRGAWFAYTPLLRKARSEKSSESLGIMHRLCVGTCRFSIMASFFLRKARSEKRDNRGESLFS